MLRTEVVAKSNLSNVLAQSAIHANCRSLAELIDRVSEKWTLPVLGHLCELPSLRFNELQRAIPGLSHRMLTRTLRQLEREGLVRRTAYPTALLGSITHLPSSDSPSPSG